MPENKYRSIIKAGVIVGTLDILAAFLHFYIKTGKNPLRVLQYIASALVGKEAYNGNALYMLLGLICHYIIAFSFTILFFILATRFRVLLKYKLITAILYGAFMWSVTQFLVLPATKIPSAPLQFENVIINIVILIICIALPLTYLARRRT